LDLPLEIGFDVKLNFDMTLVDYPVTDIYARVMKTKYEEGHLLAGLEFTALSTETNTKLQMFVQMLVGAG
jgi:adenylate cyclase